MTLGSECVLSLNIIFFSLYNYSAKRMFKKQLYASFFFLFFNTFTTLIILSETLKKYTTLNDLSNVNAV